MVGRREIFTRTLFPMVYAVSSPVVGFHGYSNALFNAQLGCLTLNARQAKFASAGRSESVRGWNHHTRDSGLL